MSLVKIQLGSGMLRFILELPEMPHVGDKITLARPTVTHATELAAELLGQEATIKCQEEPRDSPGVGKGVSVVGVEVTINNYLLEKIARKT